MARGAKARMHSTLACRDAAKGESKRIDGGEVAVDDAVFDASVSLYSS